MRLIAPALLALSLHGCPDPATTGPVAPRPDQALIDASPLDMRVRDATPVDMAGPRDAALDQAPDLALDMRPDLAPLDQGPPVDMAPDRAVDMALDLAVDMAPDLLPPDLGPRPERACFDAMDNDDDGLVDCADPDCRQEVACFDYPEDCENGVDDNGDLHADCDDVLCLEVCPPVDRPPIEAAEIQARFDLECLGCHAGPQPDALLDLTDFQAATVGVASTQVGGVRIAPGDRQASYLWRKMAYTFRTFQGGGGEAMPPTGPLDADFVDRLGDWIDRQ